MHRSNIQLNYPLIRKYAQLLLKLTGLTERDAETKKNAVQAFFILTAN